MSKSFPIWHQHSPETCGAACILMLLKYYGIVHRPTVAMERDIYNKFHSSALKKGIPGISVADYLARKGLQVHLMHSSSDLLENKDEYFNPETFSLFHAEYTRRAEWCKNRISLSCGDTIHCDILKNLLNDGKKLILETIVPGNVDGVHDHVLHWVLVYGYHDGDFLVCDPSSEDVKIRLTEEELAEYMDTPIGKICIAVDKSPL